MLVDENFRRAVQRFVVGIDEDGKLRPWRFQDEERLVEDDEVGQEGGNYSEVLWRACRGAA
jgi:hypothetical protein